MLYYDRTNGTFAPVPIDGKKYKIDWQLPEFYRKAGVEVIVSFVDANGGMHDEKFVTDADGRLVPMDKIGTPLPGKPAEVIVYSTSDFDASKVIMVEFRFGIKTTPPPFWVPFGIFGVIALLPLFFGLLAYGYNWLRFLWATRAIRRVTEVLPPPAPQPVVPRGIPPAEPPGAPAVPSAGPVFAAPAAVPDNVRKARETLKGALAAVKFYVESMSMLSVELDLTKTQLDGATEAAKKGTLKGGEEEMPRQAINRLLAVSALNSYITDGVTGAVNEIESQAGVLGGSDTQLNDARKAVADAKRDNSFVIRQTRDVRDSAIALRKALERVRLARERIPMPEIEALESLEGKPVMPEAAVVTPAVPVVTAAPEGIAGARAPPAKTFADDMRETIARLSGEDRFNVTKGIAYLLWTREGSVQNEPRDVQDSRWFRAEGLFAVMPGIIEEKGAGNMLVEDRESERTMGLSSQNVAVLTIILAHSMWAAAGRPMGEDEAKTRDRFYSALGRVRESLGRDVAAAAKLSEEKEAQAGAAARAADEAAEKLAKASEDGKDILRRLGEAENKAKELADAAKTAEDGVKSAEAGVRDAESALAGRKDTLAGRKAAQDAFDAAQREADRAEQIKKEADERSRIAREESSRAEELAKPKMFEEVTPELTPEEKAVADRVATARTKREVYLALGVPENMVDRGNYGEIVRSNRVTLDNEYDGEGNVAREGLRDRVKLVASLGMRIYAGPDEATGLPNGISLLYGPARTVRARYTMINEINAMIDEAARNAGVAQYCRIDTRPKMLRSASPKLRDLGTRLAAEVGKIKRTDLKDDDRRFVEEVDLTAKVEAERLAGEKAAALAAAEIAVSNAAEELKKKQAGLLTARDELQKTVDAEQAVRDAEGELKAKQGALASARDALERARRAAEDAQKAGDALAADLELAREAAIEAGREKDEADRKLIAAGEKEALERREAEKLEAKEVRERTIEGTRSALIAAVEELTALLDGMAGRSRDLARYKRRLEMSMDYQRDGTMDGAEARGVIGTIGPALAAVSMENMLASETVEAIEARVNIYAAVTGETDEAVRQARSRLAEGKKFYAAAETDIKENEGLLTTLRHLVEGVELSPEDRVRIAGRIIAASSAVRGVHSEDMKPLESRVEDLLNRLGAAITKAETGDLTADEAGELLDEAAAAEKEISLISMGMDENITLLDKGFTAQRRNFGPEDAGMIAEVEERLADLMERNSRLGDELKLLGNLINRLRGIEIAPPVTAVVPPAQPPAQPPPAQPPAPPVGAVPPAPGQPQGPTMMQKLNGIIGDIEKWAGGMKIDFRDRGAMVEDRDIFIPTMRFEETWDFFDPNKIPRFNLSMTKRAIGFFLIGAAAFSMLGWGSMIVLMPYLFLALVYLAPNYNYLNKYRVMLFSAAGAGMFLLNALISYIGLMTPHGAALAITAALAAGFALYPFYAYYRRLGDVDEFIKNQKNEIEKARARLIALRGDRELMDTLGELWRYRRSDEIKAGEVPIGEEFELIQNEKIFKTRSFSFVLNRAIAQTDVLLARPDKAQRSDTLKVHGAFWGAIAAGALLYIGMGFFSIAPVYLIASSLFATVILMWVLLERARENLTRRSVLFEPATDMRHIFRQKDRDLFTYEGEPLEVLDIWRFAVEMRDAVRIVESAGGEVNAANIQAQLSGKLDGFIANRETRIARGFFDSLALKQVRKLFSLTRLRVVFWIGAVFGSIAYWSGVLLLWAITQLFSFVNSGDLLAWSAMYKRPFAVAEMIKAAAGLVSGSNTPADALMVVSQNAGPLILQFAGYIVLGSAVLFSLKYFYYFLGMKARKFAMERKVTPGFYLWNAAKIVSTGLALFAVPVIKGVNLIDIFGVGVGTAFSIAAGTVFFSSAVSLAIGYMARNRFKGIVVEEKLFENTSRPGEVSKSSARFYNTYLNRYTAEEMLLIADVSAAINDARSRGVEATRENFEEILDADPRVGLRGRTEYQRTFGRGAIPSGTVYEMPPEPTAALAMEAIDKAYAALDKAELLRRMSGAGFEELKSMYNLPASLRIWQAQDDPGLVDLTAAQVRDCIAMHPNEERVVKMFDFLPKVQNWVVVVMGNEGQVRDLVITLGNFRYPFRRLKIIVAGEAWDNATSELVERLRRENVVPGPEFCELSPAPAREKGQPYTKPGANTFALKPETTDGAFGLIFDAEDIPDNLMVLKKVTGVVEGVGQTRRLGRTRFAGSMDRATASLGAIPEDIKGKTAYFTAAVSRASSRWYDFLLPRSRRSSYTGTLDEDDWTAVYKLNFKRGGVLARHMRTFTRESLPLLLKMIREDKVLASPGLIWLRIKELRNTMSAKELQRHLSLYISLANMPGYGLLATRFIKGEINEDEFIKGMLIGEFERINMPKNGQGRLSQDRNALSQVPWVTGAFFRGEYSSWYTMGWDGFHASQDTFKPLGGTTGWFCTEPPEEVIWSEIDPDIMKRTVTVSSPRIDKDDLSGIVADVDALWGQLAAGGYIDADGNALPAFEALIGHRQLVVGSSSMVDGQLVGDEIYDKRREIFDAIRRSPRIGREARMELADYTAKEYGRKNKLYTLGAWDEMQVAEDYELGLVLWWNGFNVPNFYALTSEDPGAATSLVFETRALQTSRWNKGYVIGLLQVVGQGHIIELWRRKGTIGVANFLTSTLASAIFPMLFRWAIAFAKVWWLVYIPLAAISSYFMNGSIGPWAEWVNQFTGIGTFAAQVHDFVASAVPTALNFSPEGWGWAVGPVLSIAMIVLHSYFTVRSIFEGPDDRLGYKTAVAMFDEYIEKLETRIVFAGMLDRYLAYKADPDDAGRLELLDAIDAVDNSILDGAAKRWLADMVRANDLKAIEARDSRLDKAMFNNTLGGLRYLGANESRRDEIKEAMRLAADEIRLSKAQVESGKISNVVTTPGGKKVMLSLVSPITWVMLAGLFMGSVTAVVAAWSVASFALIAFAIAAAFTGSALILGYTYINSAPDAEMRAIRGMRFRLAMINMFIPFYHMLYLYGNKVAWEEIGPRVGYWWLTPRPSEIEEEVMKKYIELVPRRPKFELFARPAAVTKPGVPRREKSKLESMIYQLDAAQKVAKQRLQAVLNFGLLAAIFYFVAYGLRDDIKDYILGTSIQETVTALGPPGELLAALQANSAYLMAAIIGILAVGAVVKFVMARIEWKKPEEILPWTAEAPPGERELAPDAPPLTVLQGLGAYRLRRAVLISVVTIAVGIGSLLGVLGLIKQAPAPARPVSMAVEMPVPSVDKDFADRMGVNLPWINYGLDVGKDPNLEHKGFSSDEGRRTLDRRFAELKAAGVKKTRVFLFGNFAPGIQYDAEGKMQFGPHVYDDIQAMLDMAQRHGLEVIPVLLNHDLSDGRTVNDAGQAVGEVPHWFKDDHQREMLKSLMMDIVSRYSGHPAVYAWEVINEPRVIKDARNNLLDAADKATDPDTKELLRQQAAGIADFDTVRRFILDTADAAHAAGGKIVISCIGEKDFRDNWMEPDVLAKIDIIHLHIYGTDPIPVSLARELADKEVGIGELGFMTPDGKLRPPTREELYRAIAEIYRLGFKGSVFVWRDDSLRFDAGMLSPIIFQAGQAAPLAPFEELPPTKPFTPKGVYEEGKKISWRDSAVAAAAYALLATGIMYVFGVEGRPMLTMSVSLMSAVAVYAVQALDLKFGVTAWLSALSRRIIPRRAGPGLIKPFRQALPSETGDIAYVDARNRLHVDGVEMSRRPAAIQYLYYFHELLHLRGITSETALYGLQGLIIAVVSAALIGSVSALLSVSVSTLAAVGAITVGALVLYKARGILSDGMARKALPLLLVGFLAMFTGACSEMPGWTAPVYQVVDGMVIERYPESRRLMRTIAPDGSIYEYSDEAVTPDGNGRLVLAYKGGEDTYDVYTWEDVPSIEEGTVRVTTYAAAYAAPTAGQPVLGNVSVSARRLERLYAHFGNVTDYDTATNGWRLLVKTEYGADGMTMAKRYTFYNNETARLRTYQAVPELAVPPGHELYNGDIEYHFTDEASAQNPDTGEWYGRTYRINNITAGWSDVYTFAEADPADRTVASRVRTDIGGNVIFMETYYPSGLVFQKELPEQEVVYTYLDERFYDNGTPDDLWDDYGRLHAASFTNSAAPGTVVKAYHIDPDTGEPTDRKQFDYEFDIDLSVEVSEYTPQELADRYPGNFVRTIEYDIEGNIVRVVDHIVTATYAYYLSGLIESMTQFDGTVYTFIDETVYAWDAAAMQVFTDRNYGRLDRVDNPDGTYKTVVYYVDPDTLAPTAYRQAEYQYNALGQLVKTTEFHYGTDVASKTIDHPAGLTMTYYLSARPETMEILADTAAGEFNGKHTKYYYLDEDAGEGYGRVIRIDNFTDGWYYVMTYTNPGDPTDDTLESQYRYDLPLEVRAIVPVIVPFGAAIKGFILAIVAGTLLFPGSVWAAEVTNNAVRTASSGNVLSFISGPGLFIVILMAAVLLGGVVFMVGGTMGVPSQPSKPEKPIKFGPAVTGMIKPYVTPEGVINFEAVPAANFPKDVSTAEAGSTEYRETHAERRMREDVYEGDMYIRLGVNGSGDLTLAGMGKGASPVKQKLLDRIGELNKDEAFKSFMMANRSALPRFELYLVEPRPGKLEAVHPHLLTYYNRQWQVAMSGTRKGTVQAVYITRAFFEDMPLRDLLMPVLYKQIVRAALLGHFWHTFPGQAYPQGEHSVPLQNLLDNVVTTGPIRKELDEAIKFTIRIRKEFEIPQAIRQSLISRIEKMGEDYGDAGAFGLIKKNLKEFDRNLEAGDYDRAIQSWGMVRYEVNSILRRQNRLGDFFRSSNDMVLFNGIAGGIDNMLAIYVRDFGVYNKLAEESGEAIGRIVIIGREEEIGDYLDKAVGDEIWVIPAMDTRVTYFKGRGIITSTAGDLHSVNVARGMAIPLAVIPNAVEYLDQFSGKIGMLRAEIDGSVRFRLATEHEKKHQEAFIKPRPSMKVTVPPAVTGEGAELVYDLDEVDQIYINRVGAKAANLGHLINNGLGEYIPDGAALTFAFSDRFFSVVDEATGKTLYERVRAVMEGVINEAGEKAVEKEELLERLRKARELIVNADMPPELRQVVLEKARELKGKYGNEGFFVRSSFNFEDLPDVSLAGHYESYPDKEELTEVRTDEQIIEAVKRVMAQKYSVKAFDARIAYKVATADVYPGVLLQVPAGSGREMVPVPGLTMRSGVLNTYSPLNRDKGTFEIVGGLGTGALVSSEGKGAKIFVNVFSGKKEIVARTADVDTRTDYVDGKLEIVDVTEGELDADVLTDDLIERLTEVARTILRLNMDWTQDIEWVALPDGSIAIVQARPVPETLPTDIETNVLYNAQYKEWYPRIKEADLKKLSAYRRAGDIENILRLVDVEKIDPAMLKPDAGLLGLRMAAVRALRQVLSRKVDRDRITAEQVGMMLTHAVDTSNMFTQHEMVHALNLLIGTPHESRVREYYSRQPEFLPHVGRFAAAEGAAKLGLYEEVMRNLEDVNIVNDDSRTLSARIMRIINDDMLRPEALPLLIRIQDTFGMEWPAKQAQVLINKINAAMAAAAPAETTDALLLEIPMVIGIPAEVAMKLSPDGFRAVEADAGIDIVSLYSVQPEEMMKELDVKMRDKGKYVAAILDVDAGRIEPGDANQYVRQILKDFVAKYRRDILELTHPRISSLTDENVKKIRDIAELKGVLGILARMLPGMESIRLSEKSIYDLRINNIFNMHRKDYTGEALKFLSAPETERVEKNYMVTAVDSAMDLRLLAEAIRDRRMAMDIVPSEYEKDPVQDIVVVRNEEIGKQLEEAMRLTGLADYLPASHVVVLAEDERFTPADVLARIEKITGERPSPKYVAIGAKPGIIDIDPDKPEEMEILRSDREDSLRLVQLKEGLVSQLYRMTLEVMANNDRAPAVVDGEISRVKEGYNLFIYLPRVEKVDLDAEMKNYDRYVQEVLIRA